MIYGGLGVQLRSKYSANNPSLQLDHNLIGRLGELVSEACCLQHQRAGVSYEYTTTLHHYGRTAASPAVDGQFPRHCHYDIARSVPQTISSPRGVKDFSRQMQIHELHSATLKLLSSRNRNIMGKSKVKSGTQSGLLPQRLPSEG